MGLLLLLLLLGVLLLLLGLLFLSLGHGALLLLVRVLQSDTGGLVVTRMRVATAG